MNNLNSVGEGFDVSLSEVVTLHVREERENGGSSMATNHSLIGLRHVQLLVLGDEGVSTDYVKGGNTKKSLLVVNSLSPQGLSENGDGGVDRV